MSFEDTVRACMIQSASEGLKSVRKLMNISRSEVSRKTGIPEDTLSDIETGKTRLSAAEHVALSAFFDHFFSCAGTAGEQAVIRRDLVREVLDIDYEDTGLPEWYSKNLRHVLTGKSFLDRWFSSFEDGINQLHAEADEELSDNDIELLAANYNIFIDETVLNDDKFSKFISKFARFLNTEDHREQIFIARSSLDNLDDAAASALSNGEILGIFESSGTLEEIFSENLDNRFAVVTKSSELAKNIMLSPLQDTRKAPVLAAYLCTDGNIALYDKDFIEEDDSMDETEADRYDEVPEEDEAYSDGVYDEEGSAAEED